MVKKVFSSLQLRTMFFDYFMKLGHQKVASSSLIPAQDPTILFTNAGMNQFKDIFLGLQKPSFKRAVSIQKCVRAGGKHNDLENVGFTQRHLTFFEMMGNFSFGDYFKKDAIAFAWNFLTKEVGFDPADMYVSVHISDQESFDIWHHDMGIEKKRIFKLDESNFWQMGDVGPCGPCTEIFVDRGSSYGCGKTDCDLACGCDRFLEVWNNVFMQFSRQADGTDLPLKQTGVDTGMGLERLCMIVQEKNSVFETDLFSKIFEKIEDLTGFKYYSSAPEVQASFNVIGDHVRSATFLIADGCAPSNDGRGYVLRKIIRRAALFAQKLTNKNIFPHIAQVLIDDMKVTYPELEAASERIVSVLKVEIERFAENLVRGKKILQDYIAKNSSTKLIDGTQAFMLYDTYGFPLEVTKLIAAESGFIVDLDGFEKQMMLQREKSGKKMKEHGVDLHSLLDGIVSTFTGYQSVQEESHIAAILFDDRRVDRIAQGQDCWIIPAKTPFFVACGGQVNDQATVTFNGKAASVLDLKKVGQAILVRIQAPLDLKIGDALMMQVDQFMRLQTMKNHTATHLLQAALQSLFGNSVKQAGSVVTPEYLRFDYTHHQALTIAEIKKIENIVNQKIWDNIAVSVENTTYKKAIDKGVLAIFGEKYNLDDVRAVFVGDFSAELCGGTHVVRTGDIGSFKIIEETSLAAGQRRIVALTGYKAVEQFQNDFAVVKKLSQDFKVKSEQLLQATDNLQNQLKQSLKTIKDLKMQIFDHALPKIIDEIDLVQSVPFASAEIAQAQIDELRSIALKLQKNKPGLYLLGSTTADQLLFVVALDKGFASSHVLANLKEILMRECGAQAGGSELMLQGSGKNVRFEKLVTATKQWLAQ